MNERTGVGMVQLKRVSTAVIAVVALSGCAWLTRSSVSPAPQLAQANAESGHPSISGSGRFVAFDSTATNLVGNDTNGTSDVFVHDNVSGTTERISVASNGSQADGASGDPSISNDGRYIAFASDAANLATDGDAVSDVFVRDRTSGTTTLVSVYDDETPIVSPASHPVISGDGRSVAFTTVELRQVIDTPPIPPLVFGPYVRNLDQGSTRLMPLQSIGAFIVPNQYDLSDDGHRIAYTLINAQGFTSKVVLADTTDGTVFGTTGASTVTPADTNLTQVAISGDGTQFVFVINPISGTPSLSLAPVVTPTQPTLVDGVPRASALFLSRDGSVIGAQMRYGANDVTLVTPSSQQSLWTIVSASADGKHGVGSTAASMSADGAWVAFTSSDSTLVSDDTNGAGDVFTRSVAKQLTPPS